ncbi:hypothetical protein LUZ60_001033 [Juncus effusus]|nr:hypothetical protein LUZ60_001033 [Juncus effusus]
MSEPPAILTNLVPHNPRFRRLRSKVWNDFSKERLSDGNFVAICHHCGKQLTASSRSGTTHLKNHLNVCLSGGARPGRGRKRKLVVRRVHLNQTLNNSCSNPNTIDSSHSSFDQETSRFDLAMMVIKHGYRFSIVEDLGFRDFVSRLQPGFQIPDFDSVRSDCMKIHQSNRSNLKTDLMKLDSRVSLLMDSWQSAVLKAGTEYLSLTCHFVDKDWKLKKKILNFVPLESDFTGTEITSVILEKLHEWGIDKKVLSVMLDNCYFSDEAGPQVVNSLSVGAKFEMFHVRSCAYILNFIIQEGLQLVKELTGRVKSSIRFIRSSQNRYLRFQEAVKISCVGLDKKPSFLSHEINNYNGNNDWASVYHMLESVCKYQKAFVRLYEWDPEYRAYVAPDDWPAVLSLFECLDVLHHTLEKFSNVENPTSNLYFNEICEIHLSLKQWRANRYEKVALMAGKMLEKFEEFWEGNNKTLMAFASILDPRYKTKSIEYFFKNIYNEDPFEAQTRIENIQNGFVELYNKYAAESKEPVFYKGNNTNRTGTGTGYSGTGTEYSNVKTFAQITLFDARKGLDDYLQETSTGQTAKSDLDLYLEEPVLRITGTGTGEEGELGLGFEVLGWWRAFEAKYPVLGRMARDILAVPVSAVPIDDVARVLNDYLSVLDCETVQGLICAQDWLRDDDHFDKKMEGVTAVHGFADIDGGCNNTNLPIITN